MKKGTNPNISETTELNAISDAVSGLTPLLKRKRVNPNSSVEVEEAIYGYFVECSNNNRLPTIEGMSLFLGIDRTTLWRWSQGDGCSQEVCNAMKRGKSVLSAIDAELALKSKISPVTYIFRSKNFYGMSDTVKLETDTYREPPKSAEEIAKKYEGLLISDDSFNDGE